MDRNNSQLEFIRRDVMRVQEFVAAQYRCP